MGHDTAFRDFRSIKLIFLDNPLKFLQDDKGRTARPLWCTTGKEEVCLCKLATTKSKIWLVYPSDFQVSVFRKRMAGKITTFFFFFFLSKTTSLLIFESSFVSSIASFSGENESQIYLNKWQRKRTNKSPKTTCIEDQGKNALQCVAVVH